MVKNRIGELRREQGLNQKELGDKLGVGQTTVSAWETGKNEPDYKSIRAMAELFEVSADYLLGFNDDHVHRGLSLAEFAARQALREDEQSAEKYIQAKEAFERGLTDEEIEELEEKAVQRKWQESGLPFQLETYKAIQLMEGASKAQRETLLKIVQAVTEYPQM